LLGDARRSGARKEQWAGRGIACTFMWDLLLYLVVIHKPRPTYMWKQMYVAAIDLNASLHAAWTHCAPSPTVIAA